MHEWWSKMFHQAVNAVISPGKSTLQEQVPSKVFTPTSSVCRHHPSLPVDAPFSHSTQSWHKFKPGPAHFVSLRVISSAVSFSSFTGVWQTDLARSIITCDESWKSGFGWAVFSIFSWKQTQWSAVHRADLHLAAIIKPSFEYQRRLSIDFVLTKLIAAASARG